MTGNIKTFQQQIGPHGEIIEAASNRKSEDYSYDEESSDSRDRMGGNLMKSANIDVQKLDPTANFSK
jgi:hypothetical protein